MQYQQQTQGQEQGQGQPRSRTPFGSDAAQRSEQSSSPTPHQQLSDSQYGISGAGRPSGERWVSGRGGGVMQGGLDDAGSESGSAVGVAGSSWGGSNSNRALRRRGSSGSSEFYFVDQPQQPGGAAGSEFIQVLLMPPLILTLYLPNQPSAAPRVGVGRIIWRKGFGCGKFSSWQTVPLRMDVCRLLAFVCCLSPGPFFDIVGTTALVVSSFTFRRPCVFVVLVFGGLHRASTHWLEYGLTFKTFEPNPNPNPGSLGGLSE